MSDKETISNDVIQSPFEEVLNTLLGAEQYEDAIRIADGWVRSSRGEFESWNRLGEALYRGMHFQASVGAYTRALALRRNAEVLNGLGKALCAAGRYDASIHAHEEAIALEPESSAAWKDYAGSLVAAQDVNAALAACERAIYYSPADPDLRFAHAYLLLTLGRYEEAWPDYDYRWQRPPLQPPQSKKPTWTGEEAPTSTLLVWCEQGVGDNILASRFVGLARRRVKHLVLACEPKLARLFESLEGVDELITTHHVRDLLSRDGPAPAHDLQVPIMSLLPIFVQTPDEIPMPPRLSVPEAARTSFRRQMGLQDECLNVGIVWSGRTDFPENHLRAASLGWFLNFCSIPGVRLFSLQVGSKTRDIKRFAAGSLVVDLSPALHDYLDTAVAVSELDLIVMTDTGVAHLAGSLRKPVWNLLCSRPYWTYGCDGERTPWYETMRLFRQSRLGDWASVFAEVHQALADLAQERAAPVATG